MSDPMQRTPLVVVVVDIVESVRLMQTLEAEVIAIWRAFVDGARRELLPPAGGRLVKSLGDGMLLTFPAVPPALAVAFALQDRMHAANAGRRPDAIVALRLGLHVCEVVVDELDIYGAGVNLAARIASLGRPGDVLLSETARDSVVDGLHAHLEDLGHQFVKHIDLPVRTFRAAPTSTKPPTARPLLPADLRPALAVIPFTCVPAHPELDALGYAMADDINAMLVRNPGLRVLSRASTSALRDALPGPQEVHHALKASFMLTGRYYAMGERVRLSVELASLPEGEVIWAGQAQAVVQDLFSGVDPLIPHVASQVGQQIHAHELVRVRTLPMASLASYSLYLGASGLMNSLHQADFQRARQVLDHLVDRHPRQAAPYALLARWHVFKSVQGWTYDAKAEAQEALSQADRALQIDPDQAMALASAGLVRMNYHQDSGGARQLYESAIRADPLEGHAWAWKTAVHSFTGEHDEACQSAAQALVTSPLDPSRFLFEAWAAMAELGAGHFDSASEHAEHSVRLHALHAPSLRLLVAAQWLSGDEAAARATALRYMKLVPQARVGPQRDIYSGEQPVWSGRFNEALLQSGIPA
jgi:adenylate cyclase